MSLLSKSFFPDYNCWGRIKNPENRSSQFSPAENAKTFKLY